MATADAKLGQASPSQRLAPALRGCELMGHDDDVSSAVDDQGGPEDQRGVAIMIDGLAYEVDPEPLAVRAIRELTHPPIPADRDVWLEGDDSDRYLLDDDVVEPAPGVRLFTAPRTIVAGS